MNDEPKQEVPKLCSVIPALVVALAVGALVAAALNVRPAPDHADTVEIAGAVHLDAALRSGEFLPARP